MKKLKSGGTARRIVCGIRLRLSKSMQIGCARQSAATVDEYGILRKMKHLILIVSLLLVGACDNYVYPSDMKQASELCDANGDTAFIELLTSGQMHVACNNGALFPYVEREYE